LNVVYVYADTKKDWNCAEVRCMYPSKAIQGSGVHSSKLVPLAEWVKGTTDAKAASHWSDVIVIQRQFVGNCMIAIEYWKAMGKILIGDVDDAYDIIPKFIPSYPYWKEGVVSIANNADGSKVVKKLDYPPYEQQRWAGKMLHGITAPNRVLVKDWERFTDAYYLPNYLDTKRYLNKPKPVKKRRIIGWGGGYTHINSFRRSGVVEALSAILNKYDVELHLAGGIQDIRKLFVGKVPPEKITSSPWTHVTEWPPRLASFDIGLIPLHPPYDDRRSCLKATEYALMGIPWVGSKSEVNAEFGKYGYQVSNVPTAWYEAIRYMLENYDEAYKRQMEAFPLALSWDIHNKVDEIIALYMQIGEKTHLVDRQNFSQPQEKQPDES